MGYTTDFTGQVTISPPLNGYEIEYLHRYANIRHVERARGPYTLDAGMDDVTDPHEPPAGVPGLYVSWESDVAGAAIGWNGMEKFYDAEAWFEYLVVTFLQPGARVAAELAAPVPGREYPEYFRYFTFDHVLNGVIEAQGEEPSDRWRIEVVDNRVFAVYAEIQPDIDEIGEGDPEEWTEEQWAEFRRRTRHNVRFRIVDGDHHEV
ncbi:hypothetical protein [Actinoplanes sp. NPDC051851]|uniref:hypothetical protein n=1 Tax=Actinoplanes sp. NPDC051851 TaxID=3154753 RepID=UPI00344AD4BA